MRGILLAGAALALAGCSERSGETATLYRNSPFDADMRLHFASFSAVEKGSYNRRNCEMVARLLNMNITALAAAEGRVRDETVGFWCEAGGYAEAGPVPKQFISEFPTDTQ